jgi:tRNA(adenine34) deaminase
MWKNLSLPWQVCFEEAWDAYCNGSIPIGATLVNGNNEIISRGRNRIHETTAPGRQTCSNKLAHAEINVLLQLDNEAIKIGSDWTLYTTTEPCVLCFGAIVMAGVRKVIYAAKDPLAGGANLNDSENTFIKGRNIDIHGDSKILGGIQRVLRTDYVIRNISMEHATKRLAEYSMDYPEAVELGKRWYEQNKLVQAKESGSSVENIVNEIYLELGNK